MAKLSFCINAEPAHSIWVVNGYQLAITVSLLPIATRLAGTSLVELRRDPQAWTHVPLDTAQPEQLSNALCEVMGTQRVPIDEARALFRELLGKPDVEPDRALGELLPLVAEGDHVQQGQVLIELSAVELQAQERALAGQAIEQNGDQRIHHRRAGKDDGHDRSRRSTFIDWSSCAEC